MLKYQKIACCVFLIIEGLLVCIVVTIFSGTKIKGSNVELLASMPAHELWRKKMPKCYGVELETLKSIYLSVKTSKKFHQKRLAPLLVTWMQTLNPHQVRIDVIQTVRGKSYTYYSSTFCNIIECNTSYLSNVFKQGIFS